jgi:hypothetical protein
MRARWFARLRLVRVGELAAEDEHHVVVVPRALRHGAFEDIFTMCRELEWKRPQYFRESGAKNSKRIGSTPCGSGRNPP